ncbi:MAG: hypothetical protein GY937_24345 [bacterium]|nr:hypothetical protein [bacterium]
MPTLRRLVPQDADELVSCFERCYGRSCVDGDFYDAKKVRSRLAEGRLRLVVAVSESGEIVGHMGLTARSSDARMADAGNRVVVYQAFAPAPAREVFLPVRHRPLLVRLYPACDLERTYRDSPVEPAGLRCELEVVEFARRGVLRIEVRSIGTDLVERIRVVLEEADAELYQLDLPLSDAGVSWVVDAAEAKGFIYAALLPEYLEGEVL